jgi:hypothetical protein
MGFQNRSHEDRRSTAPGAGFYKIARNLAALQVQDTIPELLKAMHSYHSLGATVPIVPWAAVQSIVLIEALRTHQVHILRGE